MLATLQQLVDSLSEQLGRAVALEDHRQRMVTHGAQRGAVDQLRIESILQRDVREEVRRWYAQFDLAKVGRALRIPAHPELDMLARLCVPVRHQHVLLGYVWLIEGGATFTEDEVDIAVAAAESLAIVLYREHRIQGIATDALHGLLSTSHETQRLAAEELIELDLFAADSPVVVLVVDPGRNPGVEASALFDCLDYARRRATTRRTLVTERERHTVVLLAADGSWQPDASTLGDQLVRAIRRELGDAPAPVVGVGDAQAGLLGARPSYRRAIVAARAASVLPANGPVAYWSQLGVYRALLQVPPTELVPDALEPALARLAAADQDGMLTRTLETYLDLAGDAGRTADTLAIHRTTLYYRLRRIEALTEVSLRDGAIRLTLHLGLKLKRLLEPAQTASLS